MYVMKLSVLAGLLIFSFLANRGGEYGESTIEQVASCDSFEMEASPQVLYVTPNPFKEEFYIVRNQLPIRNVTLLNDKGDGVPLQVVWWFRSILVKVPSAPAGDYTVIVTYKDGSTESTPITKL